MMNQRASAASFIQEEVAQFTDYVWTVVLGLRLLRAHGAEAGEGPLVGGRIDLSGAWNGSLHLECSMPMAREAAARMFGKPLANLPPEDIHDAVGELANMIAGHLKTLVPRPVTLSLPVVEPPQDAQGDPISDVSFAGGIGGVRVRVVKKT